jgi:deoxyribodipyrimidine photo-lyase
VSVSLVWFRNDLRLADNPALTAALQAGRPVVPFYLLDAETAGVRAAGAASRWWLHHSLDALDTALRAMGSRLIRRRGPAATSIAALAEECDAAAIYWNRAYDRPARVRDTAIKTSFRARGLIADSFNGNLLFEPWDVKTAGGGFFKVFTPFWKACRALEAPHAPFPPPKSLPSPVRWPASDKLADWQLLPTRPDWAEGLRATWTAGERAASKRLSNFLDQRPSRYRQERDRPASDATSRLSPHLAFGEIGPRSIWRATASQEPSPGIEKFRTELGWREFSYNLLFHHDGLTTRNFRPEFDSFAWREDHEALAAWQHGRTGYPIVDAGMRELWETGWMHNRVRMIAASFLIKDLLIDWRAGERWFWDTLVDADLANNSASWQWVAGSGADAAPYFRIFNPILQGEKFDPDGTYVRNWLPELTHLPSSMIHRPWAATPAQLATAGVELGVTYPHRLVDHAVARDRALSAFRNLKKAA